MQSGSELSKVRNGNFLHFASCIRLLSPKARVVFFTILFFQSVISILDLLGLALIMNIVLGFQSSASVTPHNSVPFFGNQFSKISSEALLISIVMIFLLKGILALALHSANIRTMQSETIRLTTILSKSIFAFRNTKFRKFNTQDISYAIYTATEIVFRETLVSASIIIADSVLLILVGVNLFLNAPNLFIPTVGYFLLVFLILRRLENKKTQNAYKTQLTKEMSLRARIHEANSSLRELYVSSKLTWMTDRIIDLRGDSIKAGSVVALSQLRPKYIYEMALFGGIGVIALSSMISGNRELILTYLVLFVISSSRMIPGLLRIQYYSGLFQKAKVQSARIFEILDNSTFEGSGDLEFQNVHARPHNQEFSSEIRVENLFFNFVPGGDRNVVNGISLRVSKGETVALVGRSGAGKSTLVDLILGYQEPTSGSVQISGFAPRAAFDEWPGKVSYVPQKVTIFEDSLLANIALGLEPPFNEDVRDRVLGLLKKVELEELLVQQEGGLETRLSEAGSNLSGGQIQRIGIARALFTDPSLLVLDESTSSLDSSTERAIMDCIFKLEGEITLLIVAHRLSTIKSADRIYYIHEGKIEAEGSYDEMRMKVPDFEKQVKFLNS